MSRGRRRHVTIIKGEKHLPCNRCDKVLSLKLFHRCKTGLEGRASICKACDLLRGVEYRIKNPEWERSYKVAWRARNPKKVRAWHVRRYGITVEQHEWLEARKGSICWVCGTDEPGHDKDWRIDHDHDHCSTCATERGDRSCGKSIRGLLCHGCNTGVGKVDDVLWLKARIKYLEAGYVVFPEHLVLETADE